MTGEVARRGWRVTPTYLAGVYNVYLLSGE